ncbi:thiamine biosynthesis protein ThiS [candidate division WOR-1 bacterium RIFOXYB2_FULL_42_35]|uniref:Thiamine biosynthesis protein ThiS n=1 Tax=candidate division WOR-1 bacterium RIFOXYC2_FULL_41_25 TaxID=1802586 RepID=A0A1F4TL76_UNCSA|nr:MAG: thiamine biosynthesis protein ThiS [candidate division WOR-1 bacterium RIFOXYA2_FULL_41_14]OGC22964.1 MAG: thiamine biosynthesis protein ThiS [candidate division WOR-1 bacterium RIFOXYB2_FULL_42_35]OGC33446.1 MAG: thiamine biosynthesis protein ThiS [candidate division WOR-1 bacterium RIFOXYC2_FULL_41_25]OGC42893.1 MAG: thiamine biosynthesis protein ThiS [candidate division WOR-1 bacterium RIFOXYD2_FULL_41_8]
MKIKVNGEEWQVEPETNIANLLSRKNLSPHICAVEVNRQIIAKEQYVALVLQAGDEVEIIRFMAGG